MNFLLCFPRVDAAFVVFRLTFLRGLKILYWVDVVKPVKGGTLHYTKIYGGLRPGHDEPIRRSDKVKGEVEVSESEILEEPAKIRTVAGSDIPPDKKHNKSILLLPAQPVWHNSGA